MTKRTKFQPGTSGNPETRFQPGNPHRWQPGQSGNPAGIARSRVQFEEAFYAALLKRGTADQVASLLWDFARKGEPWAIQTLLQRLAPESKQIRVTHGAENATTIDYTKLSDDEIEQLERLLIRATTPDTQIEDGKGPSELQGVRHPGLADSGTGDTVRGCDSR